MNQVEWAEPKEPSPRAVKFGRVSFCLIGSPFLFIPGAWSYFNPSSHLWLASLLMGAGLVLIWLGLLLPPQIVAHVGFAFLWFLPRE